MLLVLMQRDESYRYSSVGANSALYVASAALIRRPTGPVARKSGEPSLGACIHARG